MLFIESWNMLAFNFIVLEFIQRPVNTVARLIMVLLAYLSPFTFEPWQGRAYTDKYIYMYIIFKGESIHTFMKNNNGDIVVVPSEKESTL